LFLFVFSQRLRRVGHTKHAPLDTVHGFSPLSVLRPSSSLYLPSLRNDYLKSIFSALPSHPFAFFFTSHPPLAEMREHILDTLGVREY
jgi:hypothetical protein